MDSLEHHYNMACCSLFYYCWNGFCWSKIKKHVLQSHIFVRYTRLFHRVDTFCQWIVRYITDRISALAVLSECKTAILLRSFLSLII